MRPPDGFSERVPPQNLEAERSVLGSMIIDPEAITRVQPILRPEDFYSVKHQHLYTAILKAARKGQVDLVTLSEVLTTDAGSLEDVGGLTYLTTLMNTVPTTANVELYAHIVEEKATLRRLQTQAQNIVEDCYTAESAAQVLAQSEARLQKVTVQRRGGRKLASFEGLSQWITDYVRAPDTDLLHTGLDDLDEVYEIRRGEVHGIAGPPKMGKSALLRQMALNQAEDGLHVLFVSLEEHERAQRLNFLAMVSGQPRDQIRRKLIRPETDFLKWADVQNAAKKLESLPLRFDFVSEQDLDRLSATIIYYALTWGVDVVYVDTQNALNEPRIKGESTAELFVRIVRALDRVAKKANCAIIVAIQGDQSILIRDSFWMTAMDVSQSKIQVQAFTGVLGVVRPEKILNTKSQIAYKGAKLPAQDKRWRNVMALFTVAYRNGDEGLITPIYCDMRTGRIGNLTEEYWPWRVEEEKATVPPPKALKPRMKREPAKAAPAAEVQDEW